MVKKPMRVLEVGTAVGFSALLMSEYVPEECAITTIENYEKRIPIARQNFVRAGKEKKITLLEGDAMDVLKTLEGPYDFIFYWMRRKGSTFIICRKWFVCWNMEVCWCQTMCCKKEISLSPGLR